MTAPEKYLGDSVYASFDGWMIWLSANSSRERIALEPDVWSALVRYGVSLGLALPNTETEMAASLAKARRDGAAAELRALADDWERISLDQPRVMGLIRARADRIERGDRDGAL